MEKYSVWYLPYSKRYYLTHPIKLCKDIARMFRDAYRRSVYGWTYGDVWDWDHWFLHTTPDMLRYMADHGSAYPGHDPFDTPEKWHAWLHRVAELLESGDETWQNEHNDYYKDYIKELDDWTLKDKHEHIELDDKYWEQARRLYEVGESNIKLAMEELGKHFYDCWD